MMKLHNCITFVLCFSLIITLFPVSVYASPGQTEAAQAGQEYYDIPQVVELLEGINTIADIEHSAYVEKQSMNVQDFKTGDIMISNGRAFIYLETEQKPNKWMGIVFPKGNTPIALEEAEAEYTEDARFFQWVKQTPVYEMPKNLEGTVGNTLSSVVLPPSFQWQNGNIQMQTAGEWTYAATYTPANTLKYNKVTVILTVKVNKKAATVTEIPHDRYTISYVPGINLDMIPLPAGWQFTDTVRELDIGTKLYHAVFKGNENYNYSGITEKDITITVNKGTYNITGAFVTVLQGSILTNDILPQFNNGYLSWDSQGITAYTSGGYKCTFTPYDTARYNPTYNIIVQVNVIPVTTPGTPVTPSRPIPEEPDDDEDNKDIDDEEEPDDNKDEQNSSSPNKKPNKKPTTETPATEQPKTEAPAPATTEAPTTAAPTQPATNNNEEEESLDVSSVSDVTDADIKKTNKKSQNSNASVKNLRVTQKDTEESTEGNKIPNINLAHAETREDNNKTTEQTTEKSTEAGETYSEDPIIPPDYQAEDLEPEADTEEVVVKKKVPTETKKTETKKNSRLPILIVSVVIGAVIGAGWYFIKKRKLRR